MKIYYIDAENTGLTQITSQSMQLLDRVFVFTRLENKNINGIEKYSSYITSYPRGENQADFCIIAHLVKVLSSISFTEKYILEFILFSKDINLWKAFEFQCKDEHVKVSNPFIDEAYNLKDVQVKVDNPFINNTDKDIQQQNSIEKDLVKEKIESKIAINNLDNFNIQEKILKIISQNPMTIKEIREILNLSDKEINLDFNRLVNSKKIIKNQSNKWTQVENKIIKIS